MFSIPPHAAGGPILWQSPGSQRTLAFLHTVSCITVPRDVPNAEPLGPITHAVVHLFDQRAAVWRFLGGDMGWRGKIGDKSLAGVGARIKIGSIGTIGITVPGSGVPHEQRLVQSSGNDRDSGCLRWSRLRQYRAPASAAPGASGPADVRYFVGGAGGGGGGRGGFPVLGPPASGATIGAARTRERAGP